jgi:hypothetical protein
MSNEELPWKIKIGLWFLLFFVRLVFNQRHRGLLPDATGACNRDRERGRERNWERDLVNRAIFAFQKCPNPMILLMQSSNLVPITCD